MINILVHGLGQNESSWDKVKELLEGNYSADHQLSDDDRNNSRLWKYYEGIRKASTFIDNVDRCPELTMDEKTDLKGQARFLRAYCYWALIRVYGPVPLIPTEGLDVARGEARGEARGIIDTCYDLGLKEDAILERLQKKLNISLKTAQEYLKTFGKQMI